MLIDRTTGRRYHHVLIDGEELRGTSLMDRWSGPFVARLQIVGDEERLELLRIEGRETFSVEWDKLPPQDEAVNLPSAADALESPS